jgi:hypothetical protein
VRYFGPEDVKPAAKGAKREVAIDIDLDYLGVKAPRWNQSSQMHTKGLGLDDEQMRF